MNQQDFGFHQQHQPQQYQQEVHESISPIINPSSKPIPVPLLCPVNRDLMIEPIILTKCGHTFERSIVEEWIQSNGNCPQCRCQCTVDDSVTNLALKEMIELYVDNELSVDLKRRYLINREKAKLKRRKVQQQQQDIPAVQPASSAAQVARWFWEDDKWWSPYSKQVCDLIEQTISSGGSTLLFPSATHYQIDLHQMVQKNLFSGYTRAIRKAVVPSDSVWECELDSGWSAFDQENSIFIEGATQQQLNPLLISVTGYQYLIDVSVAIQCNMKTRRCRPIRRKTQPNST